MDIVQLFKGILVGIMASVPLGPIGVLVIQRTLNNNFKTGFVSGLGAAMADAIFAIVAMFFLSIVIAFIEKQTILFTFIGATVMIYIGFNIFMSRKNLHIRRNRAKSRNIFKDFISIFLITLTNPAFILVFVALFASVGINKEDHTVYSALITILGVAIGSSLWWFMLSFSVDKLRKKFRPRYMLYINIIAGIAIMCLGMSAIISVAYQLFEKLSA